MSTAMMKITTHAMKTLATILLLGSSLTAQAVPSISLTGPGEGFAYNAPINLSLRATAATDPADIGATLTRVEFYADGLLIGTDTTATTAGYAIAWNAIPVGSHLITARAIDSLGQSTDSAARTLVVTDSSSNLAPTINLTTPANNAKYAQLADITLTASALDPEKNGGITQVEFLANGQLIGTATTKPYSIVWSNPAAGSHTLTARATDKLGAITESVARSVTVQSPTPPTVNLGGIVVGTYVLPTSFNLVASASGGEVNTPITQVEFLVNDQVIATVTAKPYTFTWTPSVAGSHTLTARATDNQGLSTTSVTRTVTLNASNTAPTVSLTAPGNNTTYVLPADLTVSANATDLERNGGITQVEFLANGQLIGTATTKPYSIVWSNPAAGSYSLTARATDTLGAQSESIVRTVTLTDTNAAPRVSLSAPANRSTFTAPTDITLSAAANGPETNTPVTLVEFLVEGNSIASVTQKPYTALWSNPTVGIHTLTVRATDSLGAVTLSTARTVTIVAANQAPTVSLTSPAANTSAIAPASLNLVADATDTDGNVAKVDFYANDGTTNTLVGTATTAPYSFTWSNVQIGSYVITAIATDNLNATTTSATVNVSVVNGEAQVYYIHADHLDSPRQITDTNGNTVWQWENTDPFGNNVPIENPNGAGQFSFNLRFPGQYFDRETNTHYNVNRDYDPATGRYIESDPIGFWGGINTYTYVDGNPLSYTDSSGLIIDTIWDVGNVIYDIWNGEWGDAAADAAAMCVPGVPAGITKLKKLGPIKDAAGPHTVWKTDPSGQIIRHETYTPNPRNPSGWDKTQSTDITGRPHFNKETGQYIPTPHTQGSSIPGDVRPALSNEITRR